MKFLFKKTIAIFLIVTMLSAHVPFVLAEDASTPSVTPVAQPQAPEAPVLTTTPPPAPTLTTTPPPPPSLEQAVAALTPTPTQVSSGSENKSGNANNDAPKTEKKNKKSSGSDAASNTNPTPTPASSTNASSSEVPAGNSPSGSSSVCSSCSDSSAGIVNSGNGSGSNNNSSSSTNNANNTNQDNSAVVRDAVTSASVSGNNKINDTVGGNANLKTGNANVSGTAITTVNTNADGIMVSQFDVNDVQTGDLVLDFAANCIKGCGTPQTAIKNSNNGANSTNNGTVNNTNASNTFQNNDAAIGNDLTLSADSGSNKANDNGGNATISTGDANVAANSLTFANNNIAGKVKYGEVNIYGDLYGDIILPQSVLDSSATYVANTNNGENSNNNASSTTNNRNSTNQNNGANIANNLNLNATTGANKTNDNADGSSVTTGDTTVKANVLNVANSNVDGKSWWLVIVNEAGKWVGKIMGSPDGSNMGGSQGTEFTVGADGQVTAVNNANGENSNNNANSTSNNTSNTTQNNNAAITNNLNLSANTGKNTANDNLGQANITTGKANIIANIVNFVNNNVVGNGNLVVTVVNVFGKWFGDFVGPGQTKQAHTSPTGQSQSAQNNTNTSGNNSNIATTQTGVQNGVAVTNNPTPSSFKKVANQSEIKGNATGGLVAGAHTQTVVNPQTIVIGSAHDSKRTFTVNLAWIVLSLPLFAVISFRKKIIKLLPRKTQ